MSGEHDSEPNVRDVICGNVGPGGVCEGDEKHTLAQETGRAVGS
jgi:hypothetical protein